MATTLLDLEPDHRFKSGIAREIQIALLSAQSGDLDAFLATASVIRRTAVIKKNLLSCLLAYYLNEVRAGNYRLTFDISKIVHSGFQPSVISAALEFILLLDSESEKYGQNTDLKAYLESKTPKSRLLEFIYTEKYQDSVTAYEKCMRWIARRLDQGLEPGKSLTKLGNQATMALYLDQNIYFTLGDNAIGKPIIQELVEQIHARLADETAELGGAQLITLATACAGLLRSFNEDAEAARLIRATFERMKGSYRQARLIISDGCRTPQRGMTDIASQTLLDLKAELVARLDEEFVQSPEEPVLGHVIDVARILEEFNKERSYALLKSLTAEGSEIWDNLAFQRTVLRTQNSKTAAMVRPWLLQEGKIAELAASPVANAVLQYLSSYGPEEEFRTTLQQISTETQSNEDLAGLRVVGAAHLREDEISDAIFCSAKILATFAKRMASSDKTSDILRYVGHCDLLNRAMFRNDIGPIYKKVPQPEGMKGIVFMLPYYAHHVNFSPVMSLLELKKQGYTVINLTEGCLPYEPSGIAEVDQFLGCLTQGTLNYKHDKTPRGVEDLYFEWSIDWEGMDIRCSAPGLEDTNMFQQFLERLCIYKRAYTIDISNLYMARMLTALIKRTDNLLQMYYDIFEATRSLDVKVRYLVNEAYAAPMGTIRFACADHGADHGVHCLFALNAYESYYGKTNDGLSHALALEDMTRYDAVRAPNLAVPEKFNAWAEQADLDSLLKKAQDFTASKRKPKLVPEAISLRDKLIADRAAGKFNVCLIGKVVVDLGAFRLYDGPGHRDMKDWIHHSVEVARANPHVNLLIKPHPHELNQGVSFYLTETLAELAEAENFPDNVIFLDHHWYSITDLVDFVDLVSMWNGTSCLELGVLEIPTVMSSHYAKMDYPIGFAQPQSRQDYEDILTGKKRITPGARIPELSAGLIEYISTTEVSIPYEYSRRYASNKKLRVPKMRMDLVDRYFQEGDEYVTEMADRFFRH
ncbi:hypothetical protein [Roseobacter sp. SK209-2-6]|uniref:hypothetical protein n=1 Tax=Roseobacter sp. SK209-2-6 TaxID=388739 RepID=UPI0018DE1057|nr:hypothetical protein [Roseobacter sp. SK209-2-6]